MTMSPRQQVAEALALHCVIFGLNDAYGVSCERASDRKGKPHWSVLFCRARSLDGVIRVYSERFILITWQEGRRPGKHVAGSLDVARQFITTRFTQGEPA